jgi:hypothetical protein
MTRRDSLRSLAALVLPLAGLAAWCAPAVTARPQAPAICCDCCPDCFPGCCPDCPPDCCLTGAKAAPAAKAKVAAGDDGDCCQDRGCCLATAKAAQTSEGKGRACPPCPFCP